ncbi:hypothetical protein VB716_13550 [Synechococcus sp. CCY9201]|uniref:hypothetical protein n=1 Tax=Synechococcus sp. CCY9201 TaxID=174697 RepID=UPI002B2122BE|nr:hypothetical protein [Synechococcus sp. CCY9201]MEA5475244.1 hypothetical protein [Synechococcus sp. CCY9201]
MTQRVGHEAALFAAAQDVARRRGKVDPGRQASLERSRHTQIGYALSDADGELIARLPMWAVQRAVSQRARLLSKLAEGRTRWSGMALGDQKVQFLTKPFEIRALAWALSTGRRVPPGQFDRTTALYAVVLLLLAVLAGLISPPLLLLGLPSFAAYLVVSLRRHADYRKNIQALVIRWKAAGKQDPSDSLFSELDHS